MVSRIPPASPASIMLTVSSSKILGKSRMALASVAPPSTFVRTPVRHFWKAGFSWLAPRISRHCTRGRPASIMTENWRKKIAMSLVATLPPPSLGSANSLPFSLIAPTIWMRSLRSCACSTCLFSATRSPLTVSPAAVLPVNVKTGMVPPAFPYLLTQTRSGGFAHHPGGTVDHFLQLVGIRRALERRFQRDLFGQVQGRERLVEGLHPELFLAGLHGGVDLVDLVFADEVADGRVGDKDLHRHTPPLSADLGQERLAHDAFQHQRQLRADLRLLVRGEDVDDAVDGRGSRVGVQRAEREVAGLGDAQRRFDRL